MIETESARPVRLVAAHGGSQSPTGGREGSRPYHSSQPTSCIVPSGPIRNIRSGPMSRLTCS